MQTTMFPVITEPTKPAARKYERRSVQKTLTKIRELQSELNTLLYSRPTERPVVHSPKDAYEIVQPFLEPLDHEELWIIVMDTRNRIMQLVALYKGSVNSSQVRVGEVFRNAIIENSPAIIVAHNHPSGNTDPSPDDVALTRAIVEAGKMLDIQVLDHIVIGKDSFASLKELRLGF